MAQQAGLMRRLDATGVPQLLARLAVGGMFLYLSIMKLLDPINFLKLTREYNVVPTQPPILLNLIAVAMPCLELVCALALLLGVARRGAALLVVGMLLFFTPLLAVRATNMYQHPKPDVTYRSFCDVKFDCGCGTGEVFICSKLAENIALILGATLVLFSRSARFSVDGVLARPVDVSRAPPVPERA
ncbi:MAG: DoxX family protein [Phycisphaerae bacterium]|nr:DoxX family protein [Phycisphaerae bacterium]